MMNTIDSSTGSDLCSLYKSTMSAHQAQSGGGSSEASSAAEAGSDSAALGQEASGMSPSLEDGMMQLVQNQIQERSQLDNMRDQLYQSIMQKLQNNLQQVAENKKTNVAKQAEEAKKNQGTDANNAQGADQGAAQAGGKDAAADKTAGDAKPGGDGNRNAAATEIAKEMAGYKYEFYYDDKKSDAATEQSKAGNCCDLAQVAIKKFKEKGIDAKLVLGDVKGQSYTGGHYWIEYKDPATGKMTFFDPTAAASNKSADRAFQGLHSTYSKRK